MFDFVVKSSVHDYDVNFIDDFKNHLKINLIEGDFIIIDNNYKIKVGITSYESQSIDTPQDIEKIQYKINNDSKSS